MKETWFLLYGGESEDGAGSGRYEGRTSDKKLAKWHYDACEANPYSVGYVLIVTDESAIEAGPWTDWAAFR